MNTSVTYFGDCLSIMRKFPDESIDMILCDLPYGVTAKNRWDSVIPFDPLWEQYRRIIKPHGCIALFAQGMFMSELMMSAADIWRYNLVWQKTTPTGFLNANRMPLRSHEEICIFYKKLPTYNPQKLTGQPRKISTAHHRRNSKKTTDYGNHKFTSYDSTERYPTSVLTFASDKQKCALHPTQKPLALCEYLINTYTNIGDTVLDNCMGSGTTGVAAFNTNRNFVGIELEQEYYDIATQRIRQVRNS